MSAKLSGGVLTVAAGVVCVVFGCAAAFGTGPAMSVPIPEALTERKAVLDSALQEAQGSGGMAGVVELFAKYAGSTEELDKSFALWWFEGVKGQMTLEQQEVFLQRFAELNPALLEGSERSWHLRRELQRVWLAKLSQAQRAKLYWEAVTNGAAKLPVGDELRWKEALRLAAAEGLQEFLPVIEGRKAELDKAQRVSGSQTSDILAWRLRLRVGAGNAAEGLLLQVERVCSMEDGELFNLFEKDSAFRDVVGGGAHTICGDAFDQLSPGAGPAKRVEACSAMGSVLERMLRYELARVKSGQQKRVAGTTWNNPGYPGPEWLRTFHGEWVAKLPAESRRRIGDAKQELQRAAMPNVQQE